MPQAKNPIAISAADAPPRARPTGYPAEMMAMVAGRLKRPLGDLFGLTNFGVNLTRLEPGSYSALRHAHAKQDEFVYLLEGEAVLVADTGETVLREGMCAGFKAGTGDAHHLHNRSKKDVLFLEVGDRAAGDSVSYPDNDVVAVFGPDGKWKYSRKDGTPY
jgi:uncharacterized cupin superfamily protein